MSSLVEQIEYTAISLGESVKETLDPQTFGQPTSRSPKNDRLDQFTKPFAILLHCSSADAPFAILLHLSGSTDAIEHLAHPGSIKTDPTILRPYKPILS